jgi:hypothetical protein
MYQRHAQCDSPTDGATLWRYMDLTRFMSMIDSASLFFCRADLFQDAFEGSLAPANLVRRDELAPADPLDEAFVEVPYRQMRDWTAINCWSCAEHESAAMWSLYCPDGLGVAVRSTFARLCTGLQACQQWKVYIGKVTYLDYEQALVPDRHLLAPFLHKRRSFEHEHEVRAVIQRMPDTTMRERPSPFAARGGVSAAVDLDALIEGIYVAPTASDWYSDLVRSIVRRYGLDAPVLQSSLSGDPVY